MNNLIYPGEGVPGDPGPVPLQNQELRQESIRRRTQNDFKEINQSIIFTVLFYNHHQIKEKYKDSLSLSYLNQSGIQ